MHIQEIRLYGFKSYSNDTIVPNLSEGLNIIVGRNGSGKSDLFSAIQILLTDDVSELGHLDRLPLRSEGRNPNDPACLELVLNNRDRRLPSEADILTFRRTITWEKDLFTVNGTEVPKPSNILRRAGILNPFHLINQARINETATSSDADRFRLIKDIFGAAFFESTKVMSIQKIGEAREELAQAVKAFETYKKRKAELRQAVQDVEKYDDLDKKKRSLEILLRDKDVERKRQEIMKLDRARVGVPESLTPVTAKLSEILYQNEVLEGGLSKVERTILENRVRKSDFSAALKTLLVRETAVLSRIPELESQTLAAHEEETKATEMAAAHAARVKALKLEISFLKSELDKLQGRVETAGEAHTKAAVRLEVLQKLLGSSERERREIVLNVPQVLALHLLSVKAAEKRDGVLQAQEAVEEERQAAEAAAASIRDQLAALRKKQTALKANVLASTRALAATIRLRKEVYNEISFSEHQLDRFQDRLQAELLSIRAAAGLALTEGWKGVNKVLEVLEQLDTPETKEILEGYYGLLLENIQCSPEYVRAAEATAASTLFHHVVKNMRVGWGLLEHFNRTGLHGTVYFLPVEGPQTDSADFPEALLSEMVPLLGKIECPPGVQPAVRRVFGGVLVSKSLADGMEAIKEYTFNYVTLDGDKVSANGITERSQKNKKNVLMRAQMDRKGMIRLIFQYKESILIRQVLGKQYDEEMKEYEDDIQFMESKLGVVKLNIDKLTSDLGLELQKVRNKKQREEKLVKDLEESAQLFNEYENTYTATVNLVEEMEADANFLAEENLIGQLKVQEKVVIELARNKMEQKLKHLESERKLKKLGGELEKLSSSAEEGTLNGSLPQLSVLTSRLEQFKEEVRRFVSNIKSHKGQTLDVENPIEQDSVKLAEQKVEPKDETAEERGENINMKLSLIQEETFCLSDSIDSEAKSSCYPAPTEEFKGLSQRELSEQLMKVSDELSGFPQINRKAKDQLALFERSVVRIEASLAYKKSRQKEIVRIFNLLDLESTTVALVKTRELQAGFRQIFAELVNGGLGEVILYGHDPDTHFTEGTHVQDPEAIRMWQQNEYVGLSVKVSFGNSQPLSDMRALSGGQKSIVALSLILAFQKLDPTSLYLFDDVDEALDPQSREAVAKKIKELSGSAQLISSTLCKEFIEYADKVFYVSNANLSSHVQEQSAEEAMSFVQNEYPAMSDEMDATGSSLESKGLH